LNGSQISTQIDFNHGLKNQHFTTAVRFGNWGNRLWRWKWRRGCLISEGVWRRRLSWVEKEKEEKRKVVKIDVAAGVYSEKLIVKMKKKRKRSE
jgi:hypothetical protein